MEEVLVGTIGKANPEFAKLLEVIEDECSVQSATITGSTGIGFVFKDAFSIPAVEAPGGVDGASAGSAPVVIGFQVGIAAEILGDDKVDVIVHVEDPLDPGPAGAGIRDDRFHRVEGAGLLRGYPARIESEDLVVLEAVVGCVVVVLEALVEVVDAPVEPIDVKVHEVALSAVGIAHVDHAVASPLVADHGGPGSLPTIAVVP